MAGIEEDKDSHKKKHDFRQKTKLCDVTFQVGDEKLYASKAVLSVASPVFCEMFEKENKEVIILTDTVVEHFEEFLRYIYPDRKGDLDDTVLYWVLPFAYKYKVENLMAKCVQMLLRIVREQHAKNADQLYRHIKLSELYDMEDVKKRCVGHASECLMSDRDEAQRVHSILPDTNLLIQRTALRKLEMFKEDSEICDEYINKQNLKDKIKMMLNKSSYGTGRWHSYQPEDKKKNYIKALRLVFKYLKTDNEFKQLALDRVKPIIFQDNGNINPMYDCLPQDLKYELENLNLNNKR